MGKVVRVVNETLVLFEGVEVIGCVMQDVGRLVTEDLLGEILEDGGEVVGNGQFLDIPAHHNKTIDLLQPNTNHLSQIEIQFQRVEIQEF